MTRWDVEAGGHPDGRDGGLRVLHVDHTDELGGAELALRRTLDGTTPWRPVVVVPRGRNVAGAFDGLPCTVLRTGPRHPAGATRAGVLANVGAAARVLVAALMLRSTRAFREADVVHANSTRAGLYSALACKALTRPSKPLVVHLRDLPVPAALGRAGAWIFGKLVLASADAVVANSSTTLQEATRLIGRRTAAAVIPSPVGDLGPSSTRDVTHSMWTVGMVARLDPWKGHRLLLEAFAQAFADAPARLVLAGGTPFGNDSYRAELEDLARELGVEQRVDFLGHVDAIEPVLRSLDVAVCCSVRPEPMGQNVLQYLAAGLVTVVPDEGGPAEVVAHEVNGLRFRSGDASALAAALRRCRDDEPLRLKLQQGARATKVMTSAEVRDRLAAVYAAAAGRS